MSGDTAGIGSWATRRAFLRGDRTALIDGDRHFTYADFDRRTDQFAGALADFGVRQGDRVAALMVNSAAFLETMFATAKLGAVFVPMNFRLTAPEVTYLLADSGADVFVWSSHLSALARAALSGEGVRVRTRVVECGAPADGEADYEQMLASGEPRAFGMNVAGSDVACLMYTSGTTGRPKGAMLTHDNLLWHVINVLSTGRGLRETDRTVTVASMFHIGGLGVHTLTAEAFRGGWFHTGDLGRVDAEGFITLVDRKKDMIITGGENVYPIEVEQVLCRHQAVREVAVVGVPHAKWGETPIAVIALKEGAHVTGEELIGYARERLAHFKCPTRVEYVPELPRNATGKVLKTMLRKDYGGQETSVQR